DGSDESEEALNYAIFLARIFRSEITGVYVIEMHPRLLYDYARDPDSELYSWVEQTAENHKERLISEAEISGIQGIAFRTTVSIGDPSEEIVKLARRKKADLIVLGVRGLGLIDKMLVGSTTLKVLRKSRIPVLSVRKRGSGEAIELRNILVPLDIYDKEDSALDYAVDLAQAIKTNISVVYAYRLFDYAAIEEGKTPSGINELGEEALKFFSSELAARVEGPRERLKRDGMEAGSGITTDLIEGKTPAMRIVEYADSKNTDLIVINTHGRKGIKKIMMGSVTDKVVQESPCPVLALKP
ncbi:MAG TPA: universal stress protein, partial [Thermodesulfobacteriota bacterium]|nr:universal stress protein [Thermodesulfobacteriota bacterium]